MDWIQMLTIIGANLVPTMTLFLWARTEAGEDRRQTMQILQAIQSEMKDFHGRLISIEERTRQNIIK